MPIWEAVLELIGRELTSAGIDPASWLLYGARVLPSVVLIPAFGLRAVPVLGRVWIALALAATVASGGAPVAISGPWLATVARQLAIGLPVAVGAALGLWTATMAGSLIDELLGNPHPPRAMPGVDSEASSVGVLLALGAAVSFLAMGGPARLTEALAAGERTLSLPALTEVTRGLVRGVGVAVLLAAPLLVLSAFFALLHGLCVRIAGGSPLTSLMAPLRSTLVLVTLALLLERLFAGLAAWNDARLP